MKPKQLKQTFLVNGCPLYFKQKHGVTEQLVAMRRCRLTVVPDWNIVVCFYRAHLLESGQKLSDDSTFACTFSEGNVICTCKEICHTATVTKTIVTEKEIDPTCSHFMTVQSP